MKSQRSLVGMTMGARKRRIAQKHHAHLSWLGAELRAMEWKAYRIGERLRPCPGCLECEPKDCDGCGFSLGSGEDCEVCDAHAVDRYVMGCDGSGVLPAKRSAGGGR